MTTYKKKNTQKNNNNNKKRKTATVMLLLWLMLARVNKSELIFCVLKDKGACGRIRMNAS